MTSLRLQNEIKENQQNYKRQKLGKTDADKIELPKKEENEKKQSKPNYFLENRTKNRKSGQNQKEKIT